MGAVCILHFCRWSGSDLPPLCCRSLALAGFSYQGHFTTANPFGSLKPDVTLDRIFLKPVILSWAVLGTEPDPEVKGNLTASSPESVDTWACPDLSHDLCENVWKSASKTSCASRAPRSSTASELGAFWALTDWHVSISRASWARALRIPVAHDLWLQWQWCTLVPLGIYSYTQMLLWISAPSCDLYALFLQSWVLCH